MPVNKQGVKKAAVEDDEESGLAAGARGIDWLLPVRGPLIEC